MDERRVTQTCFPSRYIQGPQAILKLSQIITSFGSGTGFLIADPFVHTHILPSLLSTHFKDTPLKVEPFGGECSDDEIRRLVDLGQAHSANCVIGLGGGKTLDTAKAVSYYLRTPVVIVPTLASTDAPCSARAVIYTPTGEVVRYLDLPRNPDVVLLDTSIIVKAPVRFLISGMGDALSTWLEAESCSKHAAPNSTCGAGHLHPGSLTAYFLAKSCFDILMEYGEAAVVSAQAGVPTPAFEHIVEANTLLSGLGFESGGLGAAHAIHNGLCELPEAHHYFHGEKVAIGSLASLFLTDKPKSFIDQVYTFCEKVGLPTTLSDIGINEVTDEKLWIVAKRTCIKDETVHNELIPVSEHAVFAAIKAADAEGARRKKLHS